MPAYTRLSPYRTSIKSRTRLNSHVSTKETWHIVLRLPESEIAYRPGDSIGVLPENDPQEVDRILARLKASGDEIIEDSRQKDKLPFRQFLTLRTNIAHPTKKLLEAIAARLAPGDAKKKLEELLLEEGRDACNHFIDHHTLYETLAHYPVADFTADEFAATVSPLLPRLYSVASSQKMTPDEVHFTVSRVRYQVEGKERLGVCSHFLCDMAPLNTPVVPVYLQATREFLLPDDPSIPLIMIGPGTGVAPFRAFLQERQKQGAHAGRQWLFFGERNADSDFFYEDEWKELVQSGLLRLDTAFSRDQSEKIYVQNRLWEHRLEVWKWLESGARIYVCGDAKRMAKDVDHTLHVIVQECGNFDEAGAKEFMTKLRKEKRYLRDVY